VDEIVLNPRPDGTVGANTIVEDWLGLTPSLTVTWEF
jgi:hypothetical protein